MQNLGAGIEGVLAGMHPPGKVHQSPEGESGRTSGEVPQQQGARGMHSSGSLLSPIPSPAEGHRAQSRC